MSEKDIPIIVDSFAKASLPKPASTFEQYFKEQHQVKNTTATDTHFLVISSPNSHNDRVDVS